MASTPAPELRLAERALPKALYRSLLHVFAQGLKGCVLAGGTALSGFYAAHRRSDDLDLFTASEPANRAAILAVKSLGSIGADLRIQNETAQYLDALGELDGHLFKVTVVLDPNLFRVGTSMELEGNVRVADLETLFKMKAATLVSRCSEKDLYDLIWLFRKYPERGFGDLVRLGSEIDAGMDAEAALGSVGGATLRGEACDFSLDPKITAEQVFGEILVFRRNLLEGLARQLEGEPTPVLGELIRRLERLRK